MGSPVSLSMRTRTPRGSRSDEMAVATSSKKTMPAASSLRVNRNRRGLPSESPFTCTHTTVPTSTLEVKDLRRSAVCPGAASDLRRDGSILVR